MDNFLPCRLVASITLCRQARTLEKLIGHALKSGHHYDSRPSARFLEDDPGDITDAIGRCERRATKFKDFHSTLRVRTSCCDQFANQTSNARHSHPALTGRDLVI